MMAPVVRDVEDPERVGTSSDQIADEDETIAARERDRVEAATRARPRSRGRHQR